MVAYTVRIVKYSVYYKAFLAVDPKDLLNLIFPCYCRNCLGIKWLSSA